MESFAGLAKNSSFKAVVGLVLVILGFEINFFKFHPYVPNTVFGFFEAVRNGTKRLIPVPRLVVSVQHCVCLYSYVSMCLYVC